MCYNLFTKSVGRRKKTKHKKIWAAVVAAVLCFAGVLAGCKNRDEILSDVNKLVYLTSPASSYICVIDEKEGVEELLGYFNEAEYIWYEKNSQEYEDAYTKTDDYDLFNTLSLSVYSTKENPFAMDIYPNGAVRSDRDDGCYFADAGSVDYEGLKAAMERLERMEQEKLQQGTD